MAPGWKDWSDSIPSRLTGTLLRCVFLIFIGRLMCRPIKRNVLEWMAASDSSRAGAGLKSGGGRVVPPEKWRREFREKPDLPRVDLRAWRRFPNLPCRRLPSRRGLSGGADLEIRDTADLKSALRWRCAALLLNRRQQARISASEISDGKRPQDRRAISR